MGIALEAPGALKPATLNWLASQVRVRFFLALLSSVNSCSGSGSLYTPCILHLHSSLALYKACLRTSARLRLASMMKLSVEGRNSEGDLDLGLPIQLWLHLWRLIADLRLPLGSSPMP